MNILIIDDDKFTLHSLRFNLENLSHTVYSAENSEEAINMIVEGKGDVRFDLLICDIMMPGISGLSLVTVLRSIHICTIPIIMMSTLTNKHLLESLFKLGANDFMSKPIVLKELTAKIGKYDVSSPVLN